MAYSHKNRAWGRLMTARHDDRIQAEALLAQEIMASEPNTTRAAALRRAAAIIAKAEG